MKNLPLRPAAALLSRSALKKNLQKIQERLHKQSPLHQRNAKMMAVVKADAYGHSAAIIAPELERQGIRHFCVASLEEGIELRKNLKKSKILILGGTLQWTRTSVNQAKRYKFEVGINDIDSLKIFLNEKSVPIHLKFDTGMNRLGLKSNDWDHALQFLKKNKRSLEGIYTHYANFLGAPFRRQIQLFEEVVRWYLGAGFRPRWIHSENSAALFSKEKIKKGILSETANLVRPGISMYGYLPSNFHWKHSLQPVLELVSEIGLVKSADVGEGISYDHLYHVRSPHAYGVVSLGYADGVAKAYGKELKPLWLDKKGRKRGYLDICGAICMDMLMLKASRGKIAPRDRVLFWGRFPNQLIKKGIADPYELNLRITKRIPRVWTK